MNLNHTNYLKDNFNHMQTVYLYLNLLYNSHNKLKTEEKMFNNFNIDKRTLYIALAILAIYGLSGYLSNPAEMLNLLISNNYGTM